MKEFLSKFSKREINLFSLILFLLSCGLIAISLMNTNMKPDFLTSARIASKVFEECEIEATKLGFEYESQRHRSKRTIIFTKQIVEDPMDLIYKTTILKSACQKFVMTDYCLGEDCKKNPEDLTSQFRMQLKLMEQ